MIERYIVLLEVIKVVCFIKFRNISFIKFSIIYKNIMGCIFKNLEFFKMIQNILSKSFNDL